MLEQIFNNPDVAKAGLVASGAIITVGVGGILKAAHDFGARKEWLQKGKSAGVAIASLAFAAAGGYVGYEAWPHSDGPSNAPVSEPVQP